MYSINSVFFPLNRLAIQNNWEIDLLSSLRIEEKRIASILFGVIGLFLVVYFYVKRDSNGVRYFSVDLPTTRSCLYAADILKFVDTFSYTEISGPSTFDRCLNLTPIYLQFDMV